MLCTWKEYSIVWQLYLHNDNLKKDDMKRWCGRCAGEAYLFGGHKASVHKAFLKGMNESGGSWLKTWGKGMLGGGSSKCGAQRWEWMWHIWGMKRNVPGVYQVCRRVVKLSGRALKIMQDLLASIRDCILLEMHEFLMMNFASSSSRTGRNPQGELA